LITFGAVPLLFRVVLKILVVVTTPQGSTKIFKTTLNNSGTAPNVIKGHRDQIERDGYFDVVTRQEPAAIGEEVEVDGVGGTCV
jgi:hypothetical protein